MVKVSEVIHTENGAEGQLGEVKMDKCIHKLPADLAYEMEEYTLVKDTQISIPAPTYTNIITKFYLDENSHLPDGLTLDETTGAITGIPTMETEQNEYTVFGENPSGVTSALIKITIRKGECKIEGNFPKTLVGETAVYECSQGGSFVGTQKRLCALGAKDGEWQEIQGTCIAISLIVILIVVVVIIIAVIIFFIVKSSKKNKATKGSKGKSMKVETSKKTTEKKTIKV